MPLMVVDGAARVPEPSTQADQKGSRRRRATLKLVQISGVGNTIRRSRANALDRL
jgi:hypothetical protein